MALYRLPFPEEFFPTWTVRGNWDQGGHGVGQDGNETDEQAYAYDIGHANGGKILAARAGVVIDLDEQWPDNTHLEDGTPGPGNYVWIRHGDGTMAAYCHLKQNSVRVPVGQYVLQGTWIAESNHTGQSGGPHLHFDVHTYGEPGEEQAPGLGTQLLVHFEDKTRVSFRPVKDEVLSLKSNNVEGEYRQDNWRHCDKCRALYFASNPGSVCPEGEEHVSGGGNYTLSVVGGVNPPGEKNWRYCGKCHGLFFAGAANAVCPKGPQKTHTTAGDNYALVHGVPDAPGHQNGWRVCENCAVLWFQASGSECPATGGEHSAGGSKKYRLHHTPADWQHGWRHCAECAGLFFSPRIKNSSCPRNPGGPHVIDQTPSFVHNYFLSMDSSDAPGQSGWRWCGKCQGLWMGDNSGSSCPADGNHVKTGSGNYTVVHNVDATGPGEKGWRWCHKCQGLWMSGNAGSFCPADNAAHAKTGGLYRVQYDGFA